MGRIHPSAIVHPDATIAGEVEIGPRCVIDSPAVSVGPGTRLVGGVYLTGAVTLGVGNVIHVGVSLGFEPQDRRFDPARATGGVVIGDRIVQNMLAPLHGRR